MGPSTALKAHSATPFLPRTEPNFPRRRAGTIYMFPMHVHGVSVIDSQATSHAQRLLCPVNILAIDCQTVCEQYLLTTRTHLSKPVPPSEHALSACTPIGSSLCTNTRFPAHRTLIVRKLKGLEEFISFSSVHYLMSMTTGRQTPFS
jgi:hypothetical protein